MNWRIRERLAYLVVGATLATGVLWAAGAFEAPVFFYDSTGATVAQVRDTGDVIVRGLQARDNVTPIRFMDATGNTTLATLNSNGVLFLADADARGTLAMDGAAEVTQTFTTNEGDTNYRIVGLLESTVAVTDAVAVVRRNATSFVVRNDPRYGSSTSLNWYKIRTAGN